MCIDWVMYYNQSQFGGRENALQGNTTLYSPGREPSYMAYESENLFLNHREATAGWEKQFRNKSPSPPVDDIKWSRSVAFCFVHTIVIQWARCESLAWNQTDPILQLVPSLPKLTLSFSLKEVRARRRYCLSVSTANPFCYFWPGGAGEIQT